MVPEVKKSKKTLGLPILVISPTDLGRLTRELELIDDNFLQLGLRQGKGEIKMPRTTQLMDQTVQLNKLNLLQAVDRKLLQQFLLSISSKAPVLHFSFSVDPSAIFIEKLILWVRSEIHPFVLITIGLQPNMGAGCIVRSTNKYFDFSLRQSFAEKRQLLLDRLSINAQEKPA